MSSYTATIETTAPPEQVLAVLTDPEAIREWSPVPFELDGGPETLRPGKETHVSGSLGGVRVGFDVQVHEAGADGLRLSAEGPVAFAVAYGLRPLERGSEVRAEITVERPGGFKARLIGKATEALLAGGALEGATGRIARAAEAYEPGAAAA